MTGLAHEAQLLGGILSAREDVIVEVRGDRAFATEGRVVIPAIENFGDLPEEDAYRLFQGLLDHEVGHAADTDFALLDERGAKESPFFMRLWNVLEDSYIEDRRVLLYPGSLFNLATKNEWFVRGGAGFPSAQEYLGKEELRDCILMATALLGRAGGITLEEACEANPDLRPYLEKAGPFIEEARALAPTPRATRLVLGITERLVKALALPELEEEEAEEEEEEAASQGAVLPPPTPESALASVLAVPKDGGPYRVFDPSFDIVRDFSAEIVPPWMASRYEEDKADAAKLSDSLVLAFEAGLRSKSEVHPVRGADSGEVDPSALGEFAVGSAWEDIFFQRVLFDAQDTAVALLVDCSGSMMAGPTAPAHLAKLVAIAMHDALSRVQIAHEITGFTTLRSTQYRGSRVRHPWAQGIERELDSHFLRLRNVAREAQQRGTKIGTFARTAMCADGPYLVPIYGVFKSFDCSEARALEHVTGLAENLDGEAVLWQAKRLAQRPERRRVLFVISDGEPAGSHDAGQGARYLREAVERATSAGIEVYGLGVMSESVSQYYPRWWVCHSLKGLMELAMGAFVEVLTAESGGR